MNDGVDSDGWANYNYSGYQGRETWNEYRALMQASKDLGSRRGCGRALWEHQSDKYGNYGTPMALMLLPAWSFGGDWSAGIAERVAQESNPLRLIPELAEQAGLDLKSMHRRSSARSQTKRR